MSKDTFKQFARLHPELATTVMNDQASWQKLYELYEIYGEDNKIWNNYFTPQTSTEIKDYSSPATFKDLFNTFKNMDMESVQKGVTNIQKTIGLLQDIGLTSLGAKTPTNIKPYEPRPLYRHFED